MSDIFDEVAEDLRRERAARLWKRYAPYVIVAALAIILGVAGYRGWEWYSAKRAAESGDRFAAALALAEEGKHTEAEGALQSMVGDAPSGYATLARFRAATEAARQDVAKGVAAFDAIGADGSLDATLRDLAKLRAGLLEFGRGDFAAMKQRLEPLAQPGAAWRHQAREALAFAALNANDAVEALRWADVALADAEIPQGIRERVRIVTELFADRKPAAQPATN